MEATPLTALAIDLQITDFSDDFVIGGCLERKLVCPCTSIPDQRHVCGGVGDSATANSAVPLPANVEWLSKTSCYGSGGVALVWRRWT